jgi:hypothetical protein
MVSWSGKVYATNEFRQAGTFALSDAYKTLKPLPRRGLKCGAAITENLLCS